MSKKPSKSRAKPKSKDARALLFGVGLDNDDGHKRVTTGEQFAIVGGKAETHERMTETVVKTFEELKIRGKNLEEISREEFDEIVDKSKPR